MKAKEFCVSSNKKKAFSFDLHRFFLVYFTFCEKIHQFFYAKEIAMNEESNKNIQKYYSAKVP